MKNGAYEEIKRLLREGELPESERQKITLELLFDIKDTLAEATKETERMNDRLLALEKNPSLITLFRENPFKVTGVTFALLTIMEVAAKTIPDLLSTLLKLP